MLFPQLLIEELNNRREDFRRFADEQTSELEDYLKLLRALSAMPSAEARKLIGDKANALPSDELETFGGVGGKFEPRWRNHEEARRWALKVLKNRTTFAADGSQILPGREITLPVAAVQIGMFENLHNERGEYKKQARFSVIPPGDLTDAEELNEKPVNAETIVALRRFQAEAAAAREFLRSKAGWRARGERMPLAFFDGTLLISISLPRTSLQSIFVAEMVELINLSEETEVPIVGFVDQSFAADLISLLDALAESFLHQPSKIWKDAQLLRVETLKNWGERTAFFYCRRHGLRESYGDSVGFFYLQTTDEGAPARVDVPTWIYERGFLDEVADVIRAECVIGLGYPYALETADATAVISTRDREIFLRALQDFARRENLNFRVANKKMSKARRR
jgi:hypothetical protein